MMPPPWHVYNVLASPADATCRCRSLCTVKFVKLFATWQHRFYVDSNFLSYPASLCLLQIRPKCNQFICWYSDYLPNFIEIRSLFAPSERMPMLARDISTDIGTTGHSENITAPPRIAYFIFAARCYARAAYAVMRCVSVCLSCLWVLSKRINI